MRIRIGWVVLVAWLGGCSGSPRPVPSHSGPSPHDLSYRWSGTFNLEKSETRGYDLTSEVRVSATYLSRRATDHVTHYVAEPYYAKVQEISAALDGDDLPSEQIVKTLPERKDVFLDDTHVHKIKFKSVKPGQTISYRYRQRFIDPAYLPVLRIPNLDRVSKYEVVFNHPPGCRVDFELFFARDSLTPRIQRSSTRTSITFSDIPRFIKLPYYPFNSFNVLIWPRVTVGGRSLTPITAASFHRWYGGLFPKPALAPPGPQWMARTGIKSGDMPMQKVTAIYDYVRRNVRYIADERNIGGIVPRPPATVLKRRYGDCKDKAYLVAKLAGSLGLEVDMVLVGVGPEPPMKGVRLGLFDHVIASYVHGGRRIFFDPTCRHCEMGNLPEGDVEKEGLLLTAGAPRKLIIPAPPQKPTLEVQITAHSDKLSAARAKVILRNRLLYLFLELRRVKSPEQVGPALSRRLSQDFYNLTLKELKLVALRPDHAELSADADLTGFVVRSSRRLYLPRIPFRTVKGDILERAKDTHAIYLKRRGNLSLRLALSAPGYAVTETTVAHRFGSDDLVLFSSQLASKGSEVVVTYGFQQHKKHYQRGSGRAEFLSFCKRYMQGRRQMYALKKKAPPAQKEQ